MASITIRNLVTFTRQCFASLGGVELELPPRGPMREPPDFEPWTAGP